MRVSLSEPYSVQIDDAPFAMTIYRGDTPVLRTMPIEAVMAKSTETNHGLAFELVRGKVLIMRGDRSVSVRWESELPFSPISTCFSLDGHWYGQGELIHQLWPINRAMLQPAPFVTSDNGPTGLSPLLAPVWLSDSGAAIIAHSSVEVSLNAPPQHYPCYDWSLSADQGPFDQRPFRDPGGDGDGCLTLTGENLHYEILLGEDAVSAYRRLNGTLGHLREAPPLDVLAKPIWNTWARYHANINQDTVLTYAREIVEHGYPRGRFVIDDRWQAEYGDLVFDPHRFPDPRAMIDTLHGLGFTVHTWVVPFFSPRSKAFMEGAQHGYLVRTPQGEPRPVVWWQGVGGLLDVSHPDALHWFHDRLLQLQASTGLDGFKFDAGEGIFLPADAVTYTPLAPNDYTHRYIEFVGKHFAWSDVRSGWLNQRSPLLFRQWDKASTWGLDNGLHSVITGALSLSVSGYPLVLPDMIGGNAYSNQPDAELMIRWAQVNALMPGLQFSLAPWDYGSVCDALCRQYAEMHEAFGPALHGLAENHALTGEPIIRPIWWLSPHDEAALTCDDEFVLGDQFLVAPVVQQGQRKRDIYLPAGSWRAWGGGDVYEGPRWLRDYPAPLEVLPLFERLMP